MAGLTAAHSLQNAGKNVCVLEKSRDVGGRMATRKSALGQWDHGAQYFTARSPAFLNQVLKWQDAGVVAPWDVLIGEWDGEYLNPTENIARFVGAPFMKSPLHHLAKNLNVQLNIQVAAIERTPHGWQVNSEQLNLGAKHLVLAVPAPQANKLLPPNYPAAQFTASIAMEPCWALMLSSHTEFNLPFLGIFINQGPLGWIAQDSSKPSRHPHSQTNKTWVVHATPAWSSANLEASAEVVAVTLTNEFNYLLARMAPQVTLPNWETSIAHRWRYARGGIMQPADNEFSHIKLNDNLVLAGDWLLGGRVEGAYLSGVAAAERIIFANN